MTEHGSPRCCGEMKLDEVYVCKNCGFELKVVKECGCGDDHPCCREKDHCVYLCCGEPLTRKVG